ncbi:thiol-disulfide oxidoreductase DCC family protein [Marimonas arenosa]|uniref:DUF393 domain-containing protein n=1 Tax=Marimonas arenosa TaxID=1795305 RepID=A0AAE3WEB1_9RHOB|nr:DUF393 domain-containing protein [Marimonas arenosa]MDQ2090989.1 DUF393 domain-containing protein [Marimonas arenosa]
MRGGARAETDGQADRTTVYYDGACPLCRAEISFYTSRDAAGRLELVDVSQPNAALPEDLERDAALARFHVMTPAGRLRSGAAGFAALWAEVPGWGWAAKVAGRPGMSAVLELGYRLFLRMRPAIVRLFVASQGLRAGWRRREKG